MLYISVAQFQTKQHSSTSEGPDKNSQHSITQSTISAGKPQTISIPTYAEFLSHCSRVTWSISSLKLLRETRSKSFSTCVTIQTASSSTPSFSSPPCKYSCYCSTSGHGISHSHCKVQMSQQLCFKPLTVVTSMSPTKLLRSSHLRHSLDAQYFFIALLT